MCGGGGRSHGLQRVAVLSGQQSLIPTGAHRLLEDEPGPYWRRERDVLERRRHLRGWDRSKVRLTGEGGTLERLGQAHSTAYWRGRRHWRGWNTGVGGTGAKYSLLERVGH